MRAALPAALLAAAALCVAGCSTTKEDRPAERRAFVQLMKEAAFADLDKSEPGTSAAAERAAGWAVFSTVGAGVFLERKGGGLGLAHESKTGSETYMRMSVPSLGFGLGSEQFRAVFVFDDAAVFRRFVDKGWTFGDGAPPAGIEVYQLRDGIVAADPVLAGTKYWKDPDAK